MLSKTTLPPALNGQYQAGWLIAETPKQEYQKVFNIASFIHQKQVFIKRLNFNLQMSILNMYTYTGK